MLSLPYRLARDRQKMCQMTKARTGRAEIIGFAVKYADLMCLHRHAHRQCVAPYYHLRGATSSSQRVSCFSQSMCGSFNIL